MAAALRPPPEDGQSLELLRHEAHNALGGALGRIQLARRRVARGELDQERLADDLNRAEEALRRIARAIERLDERARPA